MDAPFNVGYHCLDIPHPARIVIIFVFLGINLIMEPAAPVKILIRGFELLLIGYKIGKERSIIIYIFRMYFLQRVWDIPVFVNRLLDSSVL